MARVRMHSVVSAEGEALASAFARIVAARRHRFEAAPHEEATVPADVFISYRGGYRRMAEEAGRAVVTRGESVRIIPEGEYAYAKECVTLQQQWETVARLRREMNACRRVLIVLSDDYWDSFWTSS